MNAKQLAEMFKAQDCARMLTRPRPAPPGSVRYPVWRCRLGPLRQILAVYNARRAQMVDLIGCHGLSH